MAENQTLADLRVEVAVLKQEVSFINKLFDRIENVIGKIDTQHDSLLDKTAKIEFNLLSTKDELSELYTTLEETEKGITARINSIEKLLSDELDALNKNLTTRVEKNEEKTGDLLKSKWLLFGGATVVLWVFSNMETLKKLFAIK